MTENLNRDEIVALLDKLGSADDSEALAAAREVSAKVSAAGMSWDALLTSERADDEEDDDDGGPRGLSGSTSDDDVLVAPNADHGGLSEVEKAEARELIDTIGKMKVSDTTRDELADYAADLLENQLEQMDLRYLRALHKRLAGK